MADACPTCAAELPAAAQFCPNCGQAVGAVTPADSERHSRLAATAPAPLVEKLRAARLTGERKPVTAIFADVVSSTALAESMDPEEWTVILNGAFELMSQALYRYEGTIAQLQGDAMLAFFGAPIVHEDDPERAVRAAVDMVAAIAEYGRQLKAAQGIDFQIRAGISTGPVVVGNVGPDLRYDYTALGDAVNVAARMQAAAQPGTVLITSETYRFVSPLLDVFDLGRISIRGKTEPVQAYQVLGLRTMPGRVRGIAGLDSPMIGRDADLAVLQRALEGISVGSGRVVFLVGDPGIGKTRLLEEFRRWALGSVERLQWVEGKCLSYGRTLPYHLLLAIIRSCLGLVAPAEEAETGMVLMRKLQDLLPDKWSDAYAFLGHLLSLPLTGSVAERAASVEAREIQSRYISSLHQVLRAMTARGPVALVCEDLHWADATSTEAMSQLLALVNQLPVLVVGTARPEEDAPGWQLVTRARELFGTALTEISLAPLSDEESRHLVGNLLAIESLPAQVRDTILARAEGNPFFVEEVVRMLIERGAIARQGERWVATDAVAGVQIPETLQRLLLARIDRLPDDAKRSLRTAAVIGRQFSARVLEQVLVARAT